MNVEDHCMNVEDHRSDVFSNRTDEEKECGVVINTRTYHREQSFTAMKLYFTKRDGDGKVSREFED